MQPNENSQTVRARSWAGIRRGVGVQILRAAALGMVACSGGCLTAGGAIWFKVFGPADVPAAFTPAKVPTLILVENYHDPATVAFDADQIGRTVGEHLHKNEVAPVIDPDKLVMLHDQNPTAYAAMTIPSMGKAVGAKQVIYIDLISSAAEADTSASAVHGKAEARIRVVDVATGNNLWPLDSKAGYDLSMELPYSNIQGDADAENSMHAQVISTLSLKIARLFYAWKPETQAEGDAG